METQQNTRIANPSILVRDAQSLTSRTVDEFRVINSLGQLITTIKLEGGNHKIEINLSNRPNGIYHYQYFVEKQIINHGKITKIQ